MGANKHYSNSMGATAPTDPLVAKSPTTVYYQVSKAPPSHAYYGVALRNYLFSLLAIYDPISVVTAQRVEN